MTQVAASLCDNTGDSAAYYGVGSSDLCIPYYRAHDNSWGYVWGDTWNGANQSGTYLGSPVMLDQGTFDASGATPIQFTWAEPNPPAAQLFSYTHFADNGMGYEVTRIPNDCIEFGGRTYIAYTSVNQWVGPNSGTDGSLCAGVAYSDDYGDTWQDYPYHWPGCAQGNNGSMYGEWTFAGIDPDGWLYIFSKPWNGSHNYNGDGGKIQLFRIQPTDFRAGNFGAQQNWAFLNGTWQWTTAVGPSVILSGNNIGEFSVKRIPDGAGGFKYVMAGFDCTDGSIFTRTATRPDAVWSAPKIQIVANSAWPTTHWGKPQLNTPYGGYIHPGSPSTSNLHIIVSQWNGQLGSFPYRAVQYSGLVA